MNFPDFSLTLKDFENKSILPDFFPDLETLK